jgi:RNA recognition motif-containing protein
MVGNSLERAIRLATKVIMNTKLYVGNLSFDVIENDLQDLFAQHGPVTEVNLMQDRVTGKARGFGFVTMATEEGATAAIQALNGKEWKGRALTVNEARPREARSGGSGGGGGGGGYGGGGRSNRY